MGISLTWGFLPIQVSTAKAEEGFAVAKTSNGKFTDYALSDGTVRRPLNADLVRNADLAEVQATLAEQGLPTDYIMVPYTAFVVEANSRRFLMDAGFADNGPEGTGHLRDNMHSAGIDPTSIDVILMSHLHGDHINGLRRKDGSLVYPAASLHSATGIRTLDEQGENEGSTEGSSRWLQDGAPGAAGLSAGPAGDV